MEGLQKVHYQQLVINCMCLPPTVLSPLHPERRNEEIASKAGVGTENTKAQCSRLRTGLRGTALAKHAQSSGFEPPTQPLM